MSSRKKQQVDLTCDRSTDGLVSRRFPRPPSRNMPPNSPPRDARETADSGIRLCSPCKTLPIAAIRSPFAARHVCLKYSARSLLA
jgi:hypothetical protein